MTEKKEKKKEVKVEKNKKTKAVKTNLKKSEKKFSKKYREVVKLIDRSKQYTIEEAVALVKKVSISKFDGSLEIHIRTEIDLKSPEQLVRGAMVLPHGTGKIPKVVVVTGPEREKEAKDAGADVVGGQDVVEKIAKGWTDFDVLIANPNMMGILGKLGKILGPKGLMPNPKTGTVTMNIGVVVKQAKSGRVEYKMDKTSIFHQGIGKLSFDNKKLVENAIAFFDAIVKTKPAASKGAYVKAVSVAPTMGPGISVDINSLKQ